STPRNIRASVHYGTATDVQARRQAVLDAAYHAHPQRFSRRPQPPKLPEKATINAPARRAKTGYVPTP
ncbi:hypothetical protein K4H02_26460, partial [Mycobacterium tuberculosis]|nr:hypothetical protein [Mycobacterium tuberculosis]